VFLALVPPHYDSNANYPNARRKLLSLIPSLAARWRNDAIHADVFNQLTVMVGDVP
jgi:hypothetical protein